MSVFRRIRTQMIPAGRAAAPLGMPRRFPGLAFALLGHPTVQAVRFLTKAGLVWFLTAEELGTAMLAGLFVFLGQHAALFGMDEALVQTREVNQSLMRAVTRFQVAASLAVVLLVAGIAWGLGTIRGEPDLVRLTAALAPAIWLGNLSVLPTALLLRARAFRSVFRIDVASVLAFSAATWSSAWLGAGPWCLIIGWYANAAAAFLVARRELRRLPPIPDGEVPPGFFRYGAELTGASLLFFGGERVDALAVWTFLGRSALGIYEWSLHLAQFALSYASNLAERCLFPILAEEHREGGLARALAEALRLLVVYLLPAHVMLAVLAQPLVFGLAPEAWRAASVVLAILALAAGARSIEELAYTALKAAGASRLVLMLSAARLALLLPALGIAVPNGLVAVAWAVCVVRLLGALVSLALVRRETALWIAFPGMPRAMATMAAWAAVFVPAALFLRRLDGMEPLVLAGLTAVTGAVSWGVLRLAADRCALQREWQEFQLRFAAGRGGGR